MSDWTTSRLLVWVLAPVVFVVSGTVLSVMVLYKNCPS